mmetsp:Transcript_60719/g.96457  ORF Transcript_60719/g.96457 Transcript_60719/m.96457 type:complete len:247 (-) Transcript_60719:489-1229(-)
MGFAERVIHALHDFAAKQRGIATEFAPSRAVHVSDGGLQIQREMLVIPAVFGVAHNRHKLDEKRVEVALSADFLARLVDSAIVWREHCEHALIGEVFENDEQRRVRLFADRLVDVVDVANEARHVFVDLLDKVVIVDAKLAELAKQFKRFLAHFAVLAVEKGSRPKANVDQRRLHRVHVDDAQNLDQRADGRNAHNLNLVLNRRGQRRQNGRCRRDQLVRPHIAEIAESDQSLSAHSRLSVGDSRQ